MPPPAESTNTALSLSSINHGIQIAQIKHEQMSEHHRFSEDYSATSKVNQLGPKSQSTTSKDRQAAVRKSIKRKKSQGANTIQN